MRTQEQLQKRAELRGKQEIWLAKAETTHIWWKEGTLVKYFYLRNHFRQKMGCIAYFIEPHVVENGKLEEERVFFGFSLCRESDRFDPFEAKKIALKMLKRQKRYPDNGQRVECLSFVRYATTAPVTRDVLQFLRTLLRYEPQTAGMERLRLLAIGMLEDMEEQR